MKSWKTSLSGLLTAIGAALAQSDDHTVRIIGQILLIIGPLLLGLSAKDSNVHGGTVAQATPMAIQQEMKLEGFALDKAAEVKAAQDKK